MRKIYKGGMIPSNDQLHDVDVMPEIASPECMIARKELEKLKSIQEKDVNLKPVEITFKLQRELTDEEREKQIKQIAKMLRSQRITTPIA